MDIDKHFFIIHMMMWSTMYVCMQYVLISLYLQLYVCFHIHTFFVCTSPSVLPYSSIQTFFRSWSLPPPRTTLSARNGRAGSMPYRLRGPERDCRLLLESDANLTCPQSTTKFAGKHIWWRSRPYLPNMAIPQEYCWQPYTVNALLLIKF